MWKKDLDAVPISSISSDRICGLRIKLQRHATSEITVLGVYLPCSDMGMECYSEHLVELENLISESERLGPIVIIGDFNAHLGKLGGVRGQSARHPPTPTSGSVQTICRFTLFYIKGPSAYLLELHHSNNC